MSLVLRDYQLRAIVGARAEVRRGNRSVLLVSPTGSGKTAIGSEIVRSAVERGGRVLWLAHRVELLAQAADRLEKCGLTVGVLAPSAGTRAHAFAPVQGASIQTLRARGELPQASVVVFDEAHHYVARDWGELAKAYASALRIGLTATPERGDGVGLGELFDAIVVVASIRELTDAGHLVPISVVGPPRPLRPKEIAQRPVDAYLASAPGRRCVVFSPHVRAAVEHACEFRGGGVPCVTVFGDMGAAERTRNLQEYESGRVNVIVNVNVLTEGWDSPATSACILARGYGTPGQMLQAVGRILRPARGKTDAILIDLRGVTHEKMHGPPDADRFYSLDGKGIRQTEEEATQRLCSVCSAPLGPDGSCPDCQRPVSQLEAPKVVGIELVKYASVRKDTPEQQAARIARWILDVRSKRKKDGSPWKDTVAYHRATAAYGGPVAVEVWQSAVDIANRGRAA
jgi:DNA repair protein RadD